MERYEKLIKDLKGEDANMRERAVVGLKQIEDEKAMKILVEPLIEALKDEDWDVRGAAVRVLGEIGDERAVEHLIEVLKDESISVRVKAMQALGVLLKRIQYDTEIVKALKEAMKDKNWEVRRDIMCALKLSLGPLELKAVKSLLIRTLKDEDADVRFLAVSALGWVEAKRVEYFGRKACKRVINALQEVFENDEDADVRDEAEACVRHLELFR